MRTLSDVVPLPSHDHQALTLSRGKPRKNLEYLGLQATPAPTIDPKALVAGTWQLLIVPGGPGSANIDPDRASITFSTAGTLRGNDGCNAIFDDRVTIQPGRMDVHATPSTTAVCPDRQRHLFAAILNGSVEWSIHHDDLLGLPVLTIVKPEVGRLLLQLKTS